MEMKKNNTIIKCDADADAVIASAQYEYLELVTEVIEGWRWHAQERSSMLESAAPTGTLPLSKMKAKETRRDTA